MKQFLHKYFGATKWKRLFDIVVSFFSLIILSPLFLFIIAVNYFTPNCKVFFSHERRGRSGKPFRIYKFQTMKNDTPNCGRDRLFQVKSEHTGCDLNTAFTASDPDLRVGHKSTVVTTYLL